MFPHVYNSPLQLTYFITRCICPQILHPHGDGCGSWSKYVRAPKFCIAWFAGNKCMYITPLILKLNTIRKCQVSLTPLPLLPPEGAPSTQWGGDWLGPGACVDGFGEEKYMIRLPVIEPRYLCWPVRSIASIPTDLTWLQAKDAIRHNGTLENHPVIGDCTIVCTNLWTVPQ
jgi:hypothetical protein